MTPHPLLPFFHKMAGHAAGLLAGGGALAAVNFRDQITLGSILVAAAVVAVAGLFTIRAKIANVWREDAEGQRAAKEHLQEEMAALLAKRAEEATAQQEIRHGLENEIAGLNAQLKILEAKTDLTAAIDAMKQMNERTVAAVSSAIAEALRGAADGSRDRDDRTHALLTEIRDSLQSNPA